MPNDPKSFCCFSVFFSLVSNSSWTFFFFLSKDTSKKVIWCFYNVSHSFTISMCCSPDLSVCIFAANSHTKSVKINYKNSKVFFPLLLFLNLMVQSNDTTLPEKRKIMFATAPLSPLQFFDSLTYPVFFVVLTPALVCAELLLGARWWHAACLWLFPVPLKRQMTNKL